VREYEIARLQREDAALKKVILGRGLPLPAGAMPPPVALNGDQTLRLPHDPNIDRMVAFVGGVWHRLIEGVAPGRRQVLDES
jgi:hypothetical protein